MGNLAWAFSTAVVLIAIEMQYRLSEWKMHFRSRWFDCGGNSLSVSSRSVYLFTWQALKLTAGNHPRCQPPAVASVCNFNFGSHQLTLFFDILVRQWRCQLSICDNSQRLDPGGCACPTCIVLQASIYRCRFPTGSRRHIPISSDLT